MVKENTYLRSLKNILTFKASLSSKSPHEHDPKTTTRVDPLFFRLRTGLCDPLRMKLNERGMKIRGEIWLKFLEKKIW